MTTYTIWFADGMGRVANSETQSTWQGLLTESEMREAAEKFDFDAKNVISEGSSVITENTNEGFIVVGGCFRVDPTDES